ncbi:MAG: hypothetical protein JRH15_09250, partial [Deltaproteobacteria bacterium]|nr:hypothetical protein [Deltaproteobacteria bacterium]
MILKKAGLGVLLLIGLVLMLSVASHLVISYRKMADEKKRVQAYEKTTFSVQELQQDLDYFQDLLERVHPKPVFEFPINDIIPELIKLRSDIRKPMTRLAFYKQFAPVAGMLNDDHTNVYAPDLKLTVQHKTSGLFFPFEVHFIDNRIYISKNISDEALITIGSEIISVNSISSKTLRETLLPYYSGTNGAQKLFYLQEDFPRALFWVYGFGDRFELVCRNADTGEERTVTVSGKAYEKTKCNAFRYEVLSRDSILFTYNVFEDKDGTFASFLKEMFTMAKEKNIENLIIDIRQNEGGTTAYGDDIIVYLTEKPFRQLSSAAVTISKEIKAGFLDEAPSFIRWFPVQYFHPFL